MRAGPSDTSWARLRFRAHLWVAARILPLRIFGKDLSRILARYEPAGGAGYPRFPLEYLERSVRWAVRAPVFMRNRRCLRSGLLGYEFLRRAGYAPELLFSVDKAAATSDRVKAHCWVCVDGVPVVNEPMPGHVLLYRYPQQLHGAEG